MRVISAKENIADDPSGILVEGVLESMAEYYSAELSQKIHRGMEINAEKCLSNGSNPGLDLRWIPIVVSISIMMKLQLSVKFMSAMPPAKRKRKSLGTYREEKIKTFSVKSSAVTV